jgi:hypothetical protein
MWSADLQWTDVTCSLCTSLLSKAHRSDLASAVSWLIDNRHSKVLVMLEDEQCSLRALEPVAAILYFPDADAI